MTELHALDRTSALVGVLRGRVVADKLGGYDPYPYQTHYHACFEGAHSPPHAPPVAGRRAYQELLSSANQNGKSLCGGYDFAVHALGDYPPWWGEDWPRLGDLLREYPEMWCGGENNDRVRDICQSALLGNPEDPEAFGSGWIPKDRVVSTTRKVNIPNALESLVVRHAGGFNVTIKFKAYKADLLDWAGTPVGLIWLDEEPPQVYFSQAMARTIATGGFVKMTFTPERGQTQIVSGFTANLKAGQSFIIAGWEDAKHPDGRTHLDPAHLDRLLAAFLPHERAMRSKGIPVLGSGMVFPVPQEQITIESKLLPRHCRHICAMDFGSGGVNHPTAAVWWAFDMDAKVACLYATYKSLATEVGTHATAIRAKGAWIPVAWPHDGQRREAYASEGIAHAYRNAGVNMLASHFLDPDTGTNAVEPGVVAMYQAMNGADDGWTIKVFESATDFWREFPLYHRSEKDSTIVRMNDDIMSAARIGYRSRRYARNEMEIRGPDRPVDVATNTNDQNVFGW